MIEEKVKVFVHPGEVVWADSSCELQTITGSCIAVCLWHARKQSGGLAHFMLPGRSGEKKPSGRYAHDAMEILLDQIKKANSTPVDYVLKIFGGAVSQYGKVGRQNQDAIQSLTQAMGFQIQARDLGGAFSRKIRFDLATGEIFVRRQSLDYLGGAKA